MGSGKTSVGAELARLLRYGFTDLDRQVETHLGKSVARIFAEDGEQRFRLAEHEMLQATLALPGCRVIALGGRAYIRPDVVATLSATEATVIFLDAPVEELYRRCVDSLDAGVRPLLKDLTSFKKLYAERRPLYQRSAWHVDTSGRSVGEIATEIAAKVRERTRS